MKHSEKLRAELRKVAEAEVDKSFKETPFHKDKRPFVDELEGNLYRAFETQKMRFVQAGLLLGERLGDHIESFSPTDCVERELTPEELKEVHDGTRSLYEVFGINQNTMVRFVDVVNQLLAEESYEKAIRVLEYVCMLEHRSAELWHLLGFANHKKGHDEAALCYCQIARSIDPQYKMAYATEYESLTSLKRSEETQALLAEYTAKTQGGC